MVQRLWTFLREIGLGRILAVTIVILAILLLALPLAAIYVGVLSFRQEAAEQQATKGKDTPPESRAEDFPLIFGPGPSPGPTEATTADGRRLGIPGLSGVEVASHLMYLPGFDFSCSGPSPAGGGLSERTCRSSADDDPAIYEVTLVEDPRTVVWVRATAQDASEDDAAEFLGSVGRLSVGAGSFDPEAWVRRSISSGGQYFTGGAEIRLYGSQETRALEIVATAPPTAERAPETPDRNSASTERTTDR